MKPDHHPFSPLVVVKYYFMERGSLTKDSLEKEETKRKRVHGGYKTILECVQN